MVPTDPDDLRSGPFTVADARRFGLTWHSLQARSWRRLNYGQYAWTGLRHDVELKLRAAADRLPSRAAFSGATAAWLLGLDLSPCDPIEATVARGVPVRARSGVRLRRAALPENDVVAQDGFRVTGPMRTVRDLASRKEAIESVVALDMALRAGLVSEATVAEHIEANRGAWGIKRMRRALSLADRRAESAMESRLRVELVMGGLPTPEVQVDLHDRFGRFIGRADLYYPSARLVIEFDGQNHRDRLVADLRRQNALVQAGFQILRFTAADVRKKGSVTLQVRQALDLPERERLSASA